MTSSAHFVFSMAVFGTLCAAVDRCSMYSKDCATCLNVGPDGQGGRAHCGWCSNGVTYNDSTHGPACVDIDDKGPAGGGWKCLHAVYDTYECPTAWVCNFTSGTCHQTAVPGTGDYPTQAECSPHCFPVPPPSPTKPLYRCNITDYKCNKCTAGDARDCSPQEDACKLCTPPPAPLYRCNMSTPDGPQCQACEGTLSGCGKFSEACAECSGPLPPHNRSKTFLCNSRTFQCYESNATAALPQQACSLACVNNTPPELVNTTWRGLEVQHGFERGEVDLKFGEKTLEFRTVSGVILRGDVSSDTHSMSVHITSGPQEQVGHTYNLMYQGLDQGPETEARAFLLSALDGAAPVSLHDAMATGSGQQVLVLERCLGWKSGCDFSSVLPALRQLQQAFKRRWQAAQLLEQLQLNKLTSSWQESTDACNVFTSCHTCIGATISGITCGWCQGGTIKYNSSSMPTGQRCAGYKSDVPPAFTCPAHFTTIDCTGWSCDWQTLQCKLSEDGDWASNQSCVEVGNCKKSPQTQFKKCNYAEKRCEVCEMGSPNCTTDAVCEASGCSTKQYQRCNYKTKQCENCVPNGPNDKNCSDSAPSCGPICAASTFGICNTVTGQCEPCDPNEGKAGCVQGCKPASAGGQCKKAPLPPVQSRFSCQWWPEPKCVNDTKGTMNKSQCDENCHNTPYAKCDLRTGICAPCKQTGDPECKYTMDYCNASCKPQSGPAGVYRGIQINDGFHMGEWDFDFSGTSPDSLRITFVGDRMQTYTAEPILDGSSKSSEGQPITIKFSSVPTGSDNVLSVKPNDQLNGIYKTEDDQTNTFRVMHLATAATAEGAAPSTFDAAMSAGLVFDLYSCKREGTDGCHFASVESMVKQQERGWTGPQYSASTEIRVQMITV